MKLACNTTIRPSRQRTALKHLIRSLRPSSSLQTEMHVAPTTIRILEDGESRVLAGIKIEAGSISVAGQETCIILPEYKVALDTGRCPQRAVHQQNVLLSHAHMDHIGGLPAQLSSRNMLKLAPTQLYLPACLVAPTETLLAAYRTLDASRQEIARLRKDGEAVNTEVIVPEVAFSGDTDISFLAAAGSNAEAASSQSAATSLTADAATSDDAVNIATDAAGTKADCVTPMTKAAGLDRAAASGGEAASAAVEGASHSGEAANLKAAAALQGALTARLLILEMTFLCDDITPAHAKEYGHMHIKDFLQNADRFQNEEILLIHFSARYSKAHILDLLNDQLPEGLRNRCTALLVGYR